MGESSSSVMVLRAWSCCRFSKESVWRSGGGRTNVWVSISSTISELRLRDSESVRSCGASTTRDLCSRNFIFIRPNTARVPQLITASSSTFSGSWEDRVWLPWLPPCYQSALDVLTFGDFDLRFSRDFRSARILGERITDILLARLKSLIFRQPRAY